MFKNIGLSIVFVFLWLILLDVRHKICKENKAFLHYCVITDWLDFQALLEKKVFPKLYSWTKLYLRWSYTVRSTIWTRRHWADLIIWSPGQQFDQNGGLGIWFSYDFVTCPDFWHISVRKTLEWHHTWAKMLTTWSGGAEMAAFINLCMCTFTWILMLLDSENMSPCLSVM